MTLYEKILTFDELAMAEFITELVESTEYRLLVNVTSSGVNASIVHPPREFRVMENLHTLRQEVEEEHGDS